MNYEAILIEDPQLTKADRPQQILGQTMPQLETWGKQVVEASKDPKAEVLIYQTSRTLLKTIRKEKA